MKPDKQDTQKQIRLNKGLCAKIQKVADKNRRSLTNQIIVFCEDALEREGES